MVEKIGEVIEATTVEFVAQSYRLHEAPPFGSFLRAGDGVGPIYAVTYYTATSSIEPGRRPVARGQDETDEAEVYRQNPQLPKLLRTEFRAVIVAHRRGTRLLPYLPPRPARVHGFVYPCQPEEVVGLTDSFDYLTLLLSARLAVPADELVAAVVREAGRARDGDRAYLVRAGKELAVLLGAELNRMNAVLRRIAP